ncbi:MAG: hypothetical protein K1W03_02510 [Mailhella sp.]
MKQEGFWQEKQTVSHEEVLTREEMLPYEKMLSYDEEIQNDLSSLVQNAQGRSFLKYMLASSGII